MNPTELQQAINKVLQARSLPEVGMVLREHPALLHESTANIIIFLRDKAEQDGETEFAEALQEALMRIAAFVQENGGAAASQKLPPIEPRVAWAIKARRFLDGHRADDLTEALAEAEKQNEAKIAGFLRVITKYNDPDIDSLSQEVFYALQTEGRLEEAVTVRLLWLDTKIAWMVLANRLPSEHQAEAKEVGMQASLEAIQLSAVLQEKACQAKYSNLLAEEFNKSGNFEEAFRYRADAVRLYRELAEHEPHTYKKKIANLIHSLGILQSKLNKPEAAERHYFEALEIYRELAKEGLEPYRDDISAIMTNMAREYQERNNFAAAEDYYNQAILMLWNMGNEERPVREELAMSFNNYAALLRNQGRPKLSAEFHRHALEIREELEKREPGKHRENLAQTLSNLGVVQCDLENFADGEDLIIRALDLYRELAKAGTEIYNEKIANTLNILGTLQCNLGNLAGGEQSFTEALAIIRELTRRGAPRIFKRGAVDTLQNFGQLHIVKNNPEEAREYFEEARRLINELLDQAVTLDERNQIMEDNLTVFDNLILCYVRLRDWEKVLETVETSKSRSLNDFLNLKSEDLMPKAPSADTQTTVRDLGRRYYEIIRRLKEVATQEKYSAEQIMEWWDVVPSEDRNQAMDFHVNNKDKLAKERFRLNDELRNLESQIRGYDEHFPPKANSISVDTIFDLSAELNRAIVLFRLTIDSAVIIFVFPDRTLTVEQLPNLDRQKLFRLFYDNWLTPYEYWKRGRVEIDDWKAAMEKVLDDIDRELIFKVREVLDSRPEIKNVLFVPNQSLALLPLHAASRTDVDGRKHYLLEDYTISYASSVSVFKRCHENERARSDSILFVTNPTSDPELRYSEEEVRRIKGLGVHKSYCELLREEATKSDVVKAFTSNYGFVHFSCHGFYNYYNVFYSGLVMKDDEVLNLSEIINSDLRDNWLTTLSACETGMVDFRSSTDEHFGLPLGFIFAGSPSVWASLWAVSDLATAELITEAYKNLCKEEYKDDKPEALRQAQLVIMNKYPHPIFWAGFQHIGV